MADVFVEHMIKQKPTKKQRRIRGLTVFGAVVLALLPLAVFLFIYPVDIFFFLPISIAGVIWLTRVVYRLTSFEFEYIVTNGELDVDKIVGKRTRKRMLTVHCRDFEILAPMNETYANEYNSKTIANRLDFAIAPDSTGRYFAVFNNTDGLRTLLIFEPNERVLDAFKVYIARKMKS